MLHLRQSHKNISAKHVLASLVVATSTDDIAVIFQSHLHQKTVHAIELFINSYVFFKYIYIYIYVYIMFQIPCGNFGIYALEMFQSHSIFEAHATCRDNRLLFGYCHDAFMLIHSTRCSLMSQMFQHVVLSKSSFFATLCEWQWLGLHQRCSAFTLADGAVTSLARTVVI